MKRGLCIVTLTVGCVTTLAWAGGPGNGNGGGGGGGGELTPAEKDGLLFMREEEKLARDVYMYCDDLYTPPIFANIATSEQRHMDAILTLLDRYELEDPAAGKEPGEFTDPDLQALYDQLIVQAAISLEDALRVGVLIEETDIADLEAHLLEVEHNDIRRVYENLLRGSQNHLAAFEALLEGKVPGPSGHAAGPLRWQNQFGGDGLGFGQGPGPNQYRHRRGGQCPNACTRIEGVISSIDPQALELVVGDITVVADENTIIKQQGRVIEFSELAVGQTIVACGTLDGDTLLAKRITVKICAR